MHGWPSPLRLYHRTPGRTPAHAGSRWRAGVPSGAVMSVGVLLVTHGRMGEELIAVTRRLLGGQLPLATRAIAMPCDCDDAQALREAQRCIVELDTGDGVLVLTDL